MNPFFDHFRQQIASPARFRFFLLQRLPSAFFAGLRIRAFDEKHAVITVKHKWFNQNPFKSMYFAIQSMAAEMSTGLLGFAQVYRRNPSVSMLVTGVEGKFYKKAVGRLSFTCHAGGAIEAAIEQAIASGEGVTVSCESIGRDEADEVVSVFTVVWSFRARKQNV